MSTNKGLPVAEAQERPLYHLIHASNVPIVFDEGCVRAHGYGGTPYPKQIWSPEFIRARGQRTVPFGARDSLHSFVPFTFCARTPAAYNIATGYNGTVRRPNTELMFLRTTPRRLLEAFVPLVTCDRMPLKREAAITAGIGSMGELDWDLLKSNSFQDTAADPTRSARIAAEILAYMTVPVAALDAIICWDEEAKKAITTADSVCGLSISVDRDCFFLKGA